MKRILFILVLGVTVGASAHFGYYTLKSPCDGESLSCQLDWMRDELHLTDAQFERIKGLHETLSPELKLYAAEEQGLRKRMAEFESQRRTSDEMDFVSFSQYVKTRRSLETAALASTSKLVLASADVMNPEQRLRYLGYIEGVVPLPPQKQVN